MKRLVLSLLLVALLFTSCAAPTATPTPTSVPTQLPAPTKAATPTTPPPTATPVVIKEPLIWYVRAAPQEDLPKVNAALNEMLAKRGANYKVEARIIDRAAFNDKISLINSSNEPYDMVSTTGAWFNVYGTNVNNEYFVPLTAYKNPKTGKTEDLLKEYAPKLWASMPASAWEAARIKGQIYAVINQQIWPKPFGISIRDDLVAALNLKSDIDALKKWEDLTPLMEKINKAIKDGSLKGKVKDAENIRGVFGQVDLLQPINAGYDAIGPVSLVIKYDDKDMKISVWQETPEYKALAELRKKWQDAGYTTAEPLTADDAIKSYKAGQYVLDVGRLIKPGGYLEQASRFGYSWVEKPIAAVILTTDGPTSTMTGVSSTSAKDPDRVHAIMQFMELTRTDAEIYNLLAKGIEGTHWTWADKAKKIITLAKDSKYNPGIDWQFGDQFLAYYIDPAQAGVWEETRTLNATAKPSVALGFVFDSKPVATEVAAINALSKEYLDPIANGKAADVSAAIKKYLDAANAAGLPKVKAELQKQLDAWKATKK
jgi:putative aldouronate transport system substrate-binding protein